MEAYFLKLERNVISDLNGFPWIQSSYLKQSWKNGIKICIEMLHSSNLAVTVHDYFYVNIQVNVKLSMNLDTLLIKTKEIQILK
jgi:hypothetical protein